MGALHYPELPTTWRGDLVHRRTLDGPVAVVGDIHGESELLRELLQVVGERHLVVAGDLCDRGPDTAGVIDLLVDREAIGVVGNHDLWLMAWAAGEGFDRFALSPAMGGHTTLQSYGVHPDDVDVRCPVPAAHRDWLLGLHLTLELTVGQQTWWVIHGGIPQDLPKELAATSEVPWLAENRPAELLWRANEPEWMPAVDHPLVTGHRRRREPLDTGTTIAIDTAAGMPGGRLTALLLPERRFLTVG